MQIPMNPKLHQPFQHLTQVLDVRRGWTRLMNGSAVFSEESTPLGIVCAF